MKTIKRVQFPFANAMFALVPVPKNNQSVWFFELDKASPLEILILCGFVALIIIGIVVWIKFTNHNQKKLIHQADQSKFHQNCVSLNLTQQEEDALHHISRHLNDRQAEIFESSLLFEQCMHHGINELLEMKSAEPEQVEELFSSIRTKLKYLVIKSGTPLVSTRNIELHQKVLLPDYNQTAEVIAKTEIWFTLGIPKVNTEIFEPSTSLRIVFSRTADALYEAWVPLLQQIQGTLRCGHTMDLRRSQMRKDVRLDIRTGLVLLLREKNKSPVQIQAELIDISGGGLCFDTLEPLPAFDFIAIRSCPAFPSAAGVKITIITFREKGESRTRYHARFLDLKPEAKEKIVAAIFKKLRERIY